MVPVTSQVGLLVRHDHQVIRTSRDNSFASRAQVLLERLIGLYRADGYVESRAHAMTAAVARIASTTITMSSTDRSWGRNGLKPTWKR